MSATTGVVISGTDEATQSSTVGGTSSGATNRSVTSTSTVTVIPLPVTSNSSTTSLSPSTTTSNVLSSQEQSSTSSTTKVSTITTPSSTLQSSMPSSSTRKSATSTSESPLSVLSVSPSSTLSTSSTSPQVSSPSSASIPIPSTIIISTGVTSTLSVGYTVTPTYSSMTEGSSSLVPPTALTISSQGSSTTLPTLTADPKSGFSTGKKAGIGIGASVGALFVISLVFLAYRFGKRIRKEGVMLDREEMGEERNKSPDMQIYVPLTVDEKKELDRRRRASELEGGGTAVEMDGGERAELEARRRMARDLHELGS